MFPAKHYEEPGQDVHPAYLNEYTKGLRKAKEQADFVAGLISMILMCAIAGVVIVLLIAVSPKIQERVDGWRQAHTFTLDIPWIGGRR